MNHHVRTRLTPKRETFAQLVARGESASGAYRKAYGQSNMSNKTITEKASRLMGKVRARVAELRAPALLEAEYTILVDLRRVLFENARIGFSDIRKLLCITADGNVDLLPADQWDDDTAAAVASIKVRKLFGEGKDGKGQIGTIAELKLWPKGEALDSLMKNLGGYKRDKDQKKDILDDLPFETLQALERFLSGLVERRTLPLGPPARGTNRPARSRSRQDPA